MYKEHSKYHFVEVLNFVLPLNDMYNFNTQHYKS